MANQVRLGIIGVGGMGSYHANYLQAGKVARCSLAAVCDIDPKRLEPFPDLPRFSDSRELIRSGKVDAVLIATPHYFHTTIGIDALEQGLHVLVEKPISVHKADCERLIAAHRKRKQIFAAMFNQRTVAAYVKLKSMLDAGELGEIFRVNWIVTDWFRTEAYYASGGWRATWSGEGGGVLLNQCPHNLDLLTWLCGMPTRVHGFCGLAVRHSIEVEDRVTAYLEFRNGATGVFVTTTCEAPGTNRLEIAGERGRIVIENNRFSFVRNEIPMTEFSRTAKGGFECPPVWNIEIPAPCSGPQHPAITQNFVDAILDDVPLIAPAAEGIRSVELANAMLLSTLLNRAIDIPLDAAVFEGELKKLIANSKFRKDAVKERNEGMGASFKNV